MRVKFTFVAVFLIGITVGLVGILYLRIHDPKYGFNIIADRIIPIGYPFVSFVASLLCTINYHRSILVAASVFPLGVLLSIIGVSIYYSYHLSIDFFAAPTGIFFALYISGIFGALTGKKLAIFKGMRS